MARNIQGLSAGFLTHSLLPFTSSLPTKTTHPYRPALYLCIVHLNETRAPWIQIFLLDSYQSLSLPLPPSTFPLASQFCYSHFSSFHTTLSLAGFIPQFPQGLCADIGQFMFISSLDLIPCPITRPVGFMIYLQNNKMLALVLNCLPIKICSSLDVNPRYSEMGRPG